MTEGELEQLEAKLDAIVAELAELRALLQRRGWLPAVLTPEAAARELSISLPTLRRMMKARGLRTVLINKRTMVPAKEILRLATPAELPSSRPPAPRKKQRAADARTEAEKIRAALKRPPKKGTPHDAI